MRQQELGNRAAFDVVEAPASEEPGEARPQPAPAVPDRPKAAGAFMIAAYGITYLLV